jgi:hypothetical protein
MFVKYGYNANKEERLSLEKTTMQSISMHSY